MNHLSLRLLAVLDRVDVRIEPATERTVSEHANHYATEEVLYIYIYIYIYIIIIIIIGSVCPIEDRAEYPKAWPHITQ